MSLRPEDLPCETEALRALVLSLSAENAALKAAIKQINLQAFGQRSERSHLVIEGQLGLELGDQAEAVDTPAAEVIPFPPGPRAKRKAARRNIGQLPDWLPRVVEVIEPESKSCACCCGALHKSPKRRPGRASSMAAWRPRPWSPVSWFGNTRGTCP
jgi:transposase